MNFVLLYHYINSWVGNRERSSLLKLRLVYYESSPLQTAGFLPYCMCHVITWLECKTLMKTSLIKLNFSLVVTQSKCIMPHYSVICRSPTLYCYKEGLFSMRVAIINSLIKLQNELSQLKFHINFPAYAFQTLINIVCLYFFIRVNAIHIIIFCLTNIYDKHLLKLL